MTSGNVQLKTDLAQEALVAGLTANSLHSITTSPIRLRSSLGSFLTSQRTSSKHSIALLTQDLKLGLQGVEIDVVIV